MKKRYFKQLGLVGTCVIMVSFLVLTVSGGEENYQLQRSVEPVTEVITPQHMTVEEATRSIPREYDRYFTVNSPRNVILFQGPAEILKKCRRDLQLIDTPVAHVSVDLLAVELTEQAYRSLGLDWIYSQGNADASQLTGGAGQTFYQGMGQLPQEFLARLSKLIEDGEAVILANPSTVAMSGKESMVQMRKTLNYFFTEGHDTSGRPVIKKSDISADTEGRVTPTVLADDKIHLRVNINMGSFHFVGNEGLPEQTNRQSRTEVTVQDGQTIVIGGLRPFLASETPAKPLPQEDPDDPAQVEPLEKEEPKINRSVLTIFITAHVIN